MRKSRHQRKFQTKINSSIRKLHYGPLTLRRTNVKVNNTPLERVIKHKSLGVQIDESLNWRPHIHTISKKISAGIAILRRVSRFIPFDTRVNMYNALVMPYFNYCGAVWGNINKELADKLQKLQNRAARILTFSNYDVRSSVLLD